LGAGAGAVFWVGDGAGRGGAEVAGGCAMGAGIGDAPGACAVAKAKSKPIATATRWRRAIGGETVAATAVGFGDGRWTRQQ
jgi:hypothetical protein